MLACINASRCRFVILSVLFRRRFKISSGPGALSRESLLIAISSCHIVMFVLRDTDSEYIVVSWISLVSAGGGCEKNAL